MTYITAIFSAVDFYQAILWGYNNKIFSTNNPELSIKVTIMFGFALNLIVACLMTAFLKFHIMLATENKTTIENLDKLGKPF
jgi:type VI protein secretion system component VasF